MRLADLRVRAAPARHVRDRRHARPACRRSATAASAGSACPASCTCCTRTRRTTARRAPTPASRYRIVYVEPELVRDALGGGPLPFVADPVQRRSAGDRVSWRRSSRTSTSPVDDLAPRRDRRDGRRRPCARSAAGVTRRGAIDLAARRARARAPRRARRASDARRRRSSGSPASTASRSRASSGAPTARAPTATGRMRRLAVGARGDRGGRAARAGRRRRRLRRPEPHDPPVRARLRPHAGALGARSRDLAAHSPRTGDLGRRSRRIPAAWRVSQHDPAEPYEAASRRGCAPAAESTPSSARRCRSSASS